MRYMAVLLTVFYMFACVGMELFGGALEREMLRATESAYGNDNYWRNNFNSLYNSFVTLFELMVVNNWAITAEGYMAAVGPSALVFFLVFYVVSVVVVMNVVVAFLISAYSVFKGDAEAALAGDGMDERQRLAQRMQRAAEDDGDESASCEDSIAENLSSFVKLGKKRETRNELKRVYLPS